MHSVWEQEQFRTTKDVLIVGAGLTALFTALELKAAQPDIQVCVLEKGPYPTGASVKNAGFACFGSLNEILDDTQRHGFDYAMLLVERRLKGLEKLRTLFTPEQIGFAVHGGIDLYENGQEEKLEQALALLPEVNAMLGSQMYYLKRNVLFPRALSRYLFCEGEASLNTGLLVKRLLQLAHQKGVEIRFEREVKQLSKGQLWEALLQDGSVYKSEKILLATNGFTKNLYPSLNVEPARGQVLLTPPLKGLNLKANVHLQSGYFYARPYAGGILLGGGRHLDRDTERSEEDQLNPKIQDALDKLLQKHFCNDQLPPIRTRWTGIMAFGKQNEKEAIVEELEPGLFCAVRLGGMGVALSSQVGKEAATLLLRA